MQLFPKVAALGIASFVAFVYLTTYAHEAGHVLICELSGYDGMIIIQPYTMETRSATCTGMPENRTLSLAMGGIFGMMAAGIPLLFFRKNQYIVMGAVPQLVANAITGSMETFATSWYNTSGAWPYLIASAPMISVFMALLLYYASKVKQPKKV